MTETLFGCSYSDVWVSPSNWKTTTAKAALQKEWYVQCYFYDPLFKDKYPKGKPYRKKLNRFATLELRKQAAERMLEKIPELFDAGYNPITKKYMVIESATPPEPEKLGPNMPAEFAIEDVWNKIRNAAIEALPADQREKAKPFDDVRVAKNRFLKALKELRYNDVPIKDLSIAQVKETIVQANITEGYYNKFLSYMSKIFTELIEYGCVQNNYFKLYKKAKPTKTIRETLSDEDFDEVMTYLRTHHYNFYRYGMMFHESGARSTELHRLKVKEVNLDKQEYKVLVMKGGQYHEEIKVIMRDVLPLWKEVISEAQSEDDYVFSRCFSPGPDKIAARQVSRKWNKYIKKRFSDGRGINITADFYSLKHLFLDRLDELQHQVASVPANAAQRLASHTTDKVTNSVYLVNKKKRELESLKKVTLLRSA